MLLKIFQPIIAFKLPCLSIIPASPVKDLKDHSKCTSNLFLSLPLLCHELHMDQSPRSLPGNQGLSWGPLPTCPDASHTGHSTAISGAHCTIFQFWAFSKAVPSARNSCSDPQATPISLFRFRHYELNRLLLFGASMLPARGLDLLIAHICMWSVLPWDLTNYSSKTKIPLNYLWALSLA